MTSATYRMGSGTTPEKNLRDPQNQLLSRFERRRLEVEEIRDGLLAMDGSLDLTMGGTLQTGFGTDTEKQQRPPEFEAGDGPHRRMVYLPLRRANLPTLLNLFDFGDATTSMGKRAHTNVAPQALFMMNSEFVADRARNLACPAGTRGHRSGQANRSGLSHYPEPDAGNGGAASRTGLPG